MTINQQPLEFVHRSLGYQGVVRLAVLLLVLGIWTSTDGPRIAANLPTPWIGVSERILIFSSLLWTAVFAVFLLGERLTAWRVAGLACIVAGDVLVGGSSLLQAFFLRVAAGGRLGRLLGDGEMHRPDEETKNQECVVPVRTMGAHG